MGMTADEMMQRMTAAEFAERVAEWNMTQREQREAAERARRGR